MTMIISSSIIIIIVITVSVQNKVVFADVSAMIYVSVVSYCFFGLQLTWFFFAGFVMCAAALSMYYGAPPKEDAMQVCSPSSHCERSNADCPLNLTLIRHVGVLYGEDRR